MPIKALERVRGVDISENIQKAKHKKRTTGFLGFYTDIVSLFFVAFHTQLIHWGVKCPSKPGKN